MIRLSRHENRGFVLLEITVSLVLLGIAIAALMRSFTISMSAIRKNDVTTQAYVLAESVLQNIEMEPPTGTVTGSFEEEGYPYYSYTLEYEEEEIDYRHLETVNKIEDLKPLRHVALTIEYDNKRNKKLVPVKVELYLPPIERYSYQTKFLNELFEEED